MKAMTLSAQAPVETAPLDQREIPDPTPGPGSLRIRVGACGVCHTDLHIVEGDLPARRLPIIPGHQAVGVVDAVGEGTDPAWIGHRVGVPWLSRACGACRFCRSGRENLCDAIAFTGYDVDGGYADAMLADAEFVVPIPDEFTDTQAAPLLCAGIIGYRSLRLSQAAPGSRLALVGFGAAAHIAVQIAVKRGIEVHVVTRSAEHRQLAEELGASWTGRVEDEPPARWDAAIIFAPAGELVPAVLKRMEKAGVIALGGIHMSPIPPIDYADLWGERVIRSVANATRQDAAELMTEAAAIPVRTHVTTYALADANRALADLKHSRFSGAAVLSGR